jgi:hypothetical protein
MALYGRCQDAFRERKEGRIRVMDEKKEVLIISAGMSYAWKYDIPHGLDGVGEDDFLVRISFLLVVPAMVDELHLLQDC